MSVVTGEIVGLICNNEILLPGFFLNQNYFPMICKEYSSLTPIQKVEFTGKLLHAVMTSPVLFKEAKLLIKAAEKAGLFDGVTINPAPIEEKTLES